MSRLVPVRGAGRTARTAGWLVAALMALLVVVPLAPGRAAADPAVPYWVVPGQPGTPSDLTLPGVADRVLGDSHRWPEIFELNQGRPQPDGLTLTEPAQELRAGWVLELPEGARSGEIRIGPLPDSTAQPGLPPANQPGAPPVADGQPGLPPAGQPGVPPDEPGAPPAGVPHVRVIGLAPAAGAAVLVGAALLLAAGVAGAVLLRRRSRGPGAAVPTASSAGAERTGRDRAVLERALGQLPAGAARPQVYAAVVGPDRVSLRLAPALPQAPPPWQVREQGSVWEAPNWQLDAVSAGPGTPELPLLATVGTIGGELTVVNLGRAPGLVALTGDPATSMSVAGAFLDEIGSDPAAAAVAISVLGPVPGGRLAPGRIRTISDVRELAEAHPAGPAGAAGTAGAPAGTAGGAGGPARSLRRQFVVVTAPIPPAALERLGALAAGSDNSAAVLVVGDAPNAAWRFESGPDGSFDVGVLGLRLDQPRSGRGRTGSGDRGQALDRRMVRQ
ncbi:hypothetical protein AB0J86_27525 [Micromonospora sp. NPDC049559]|uniref:hypothetical protein n=1 Tax=Micromonospora sp. NPDC049559 TaxID=3155923 RepID=UPI00343BBDF8